MPKVIQYHSSTTGADAIGNSIFQLDALLRRRGVESYVACADSQARAAPGGVLPASSLLNTSMKTSLYEKDVLLVHYSFYDEFAERLASLPLRRAIVYHNITPSSFFRRVGLDGMAGVCDAGRAQLARLAPMFAAGIGDSDYNCDELRDLGFKQVKTIPVLVGTDSFASDDIDPELLLQIRAGAEVNILFIGRFVPNKGFEKLISVVAAFRRSFSTTINLHLVGKVWDEAYFASLVAHAGQLGVASLLRFHIHAGPERLRTLLAAADAFVCMSEHEGFMVPIVEAFAAGCPVIAVKGAAIGETMGGAGILIEDPGPEVVAGLVHLLGTDRRLRERVICGQSRRAVEFRAPRTERLWLDTIRTLSA